MNYYIFLNNWLKHFFFVESKDDKYLTNLLNELFTNIIIFYFKSSLIFMLNWKKKFTFPFEAPNTEFNIKSGGTIASARDTASFLREEHKSIIDPLIITDANGPFA